MSLLINNIIALSVIGQTGDAGSVSEKRSIPPEGIRVNRPANAVVREAQSVLFAIGPKGGIYGGGYYFVAESAGETAWITGDGVGFYGWHTANLVRDHQIARYFDALSCGDTSSPYYVRNEDGTVNYKRLEDATKKYNQTHFKGRMERTKRFGSHTWDKMNADLRDGKVDEAKVNPSSWTGGDKPSDANLLGGVANTKLGMITFELTSQALQILREDALRAKVASNQGITPKVSSLNDRIDPVRRVCNYVHEIVGGISDFSLTWDNKAGKLLVNGKINWDYAVVDKNVAEAKFKALLEGAGVSNADKLDFEKELISEISGGVIGYATLAVLKVATGSDQIDLTAVRLKAQEAIQKRYPGAGSGSEMVIHTGEAAGAVPDDSGGIPEEIAPGLSSPILCDAYPETPNLEFNPNSYVHKYIAPPGVEIEKGYTIFENFEELTDFQKERYIHTFRTSDHWARFLIVGNNKLTEGLTIEDRRKKLWTEILCKDFHLEEGRKMIAVYPDVNTKRNDDYWIILTPGGFPVTLDLSRLDKDDLIAVLDHRMYLVNKNILPGSVEYREEMTAKVESLSK